MCWLRLNRLQSRFYYWAGKHNQKRLNRWWSLQACRVAGRHYENHLTVADTGHNEEGIKQVLENIKQQRFTHLHMVFGVVNDKSIHSILALLPKDGTLLFCEGFGARALDSGELAAQAKKHKLCGTAYNTVEAGLMAARRR